MGVRTPTVFSSTVGQDSKHRSLKLVEVRDYPIVKQIGSCDGRLGRVELANRDFGIGIDEGLLIYPPNPFQAADVKSILGPEVTRVHGFNLSDGNVVILFLFEG